MPNPYEDIFGNSEEPKKPEETPSDEFSHSDPSPAENQKEPLDEVLDSIRLFEHHAESFSSLLSKTKSIDHKPVNEITKLFIKIDDGIDKHDKGSLKAERSYHQLLQEKFTAIITPMRQLAEIHLNTIKQFNRDIDKNYYSIDKTDREVKSEKSTAINGINLQRKILANGATDLEILDDALAATEQRIKQYINAGGNNNISDAEFALLCKKRKTLTNGADHRFDFSFFKINLIDKTAISLGVYLKETTAQYLSKLGDVFN